MPRVFALAALLVFGPGAAVAAPVVVRLAPEALVHTDEVVLSEVAEIQGDGPLAERIRGLRLTPAPPVGVTHALLADTVRTRLGSDALRVEVTGATRTLVTRAFQVVRAADLIQAVRREARARLDAAESRGEPSSLTPISRPDDLRLPTGDLRFEVRLHEGGANAPTLTATVTVRVNGRERHQALLTFQLTRVVTVVVVVRPLDLRRVLGPDDFRIERRSAGDVPPDALAELAEPSDYELLRSAQAGEVVTPRLIRPRLAIKRGELVTLLLEGEGFRISTQGQASEDGRRGETVRVVNLSSKREVVGWVEGGGVVRVPYRKLAAER
jgi:flagella basal body P-ring formation protein FlgA